MHCHSLHTNALMKKIYMQIGYLYSGSLGLLCNPNKHYTHGHPWNTIKSIIHIMYFNNSGNVYLLYSCGIVAHCKPL